VTTQVNRRKVRAVLAGGLVLGVGAAVTLAAWNDSEFATGQFAAGSFNLQGSTAGPTSGYSDHAEAGDAATLQFSLSPDNLSPGDVVAAPFWVRLDGSTTSPAALTAADIASSGDNVAHLSYSVEAIAPDDTCDPDATGTVVASGDALDALPAGADVLLDAGADSDPGEAVQLCFKVTAEETLEQGAGATATWHFTATSE